MTASRAFASRVALVCGLIAPLAACGSDSDSDDLNEQAAPVVARHVDDAYAAYGAALDAARALDTAIDAFLKAPTREGLEAAKTAWIAARVPYRRTEAFRFYDGPIEGAEERINSWPLDEAYIDYVATADGKGVLEGGIINDAAGFPALSKQALSDANFKTSETNVSVGYHAIEFLLWGQDRDKAGPGARPFTDFVDGGTAKNADRRRQYLATVSDLLVDDLTTVHDGYGPDSDFRKDFIAAPKDSLALILTGIGTLAASELSGERMLPAYKDADQEQEHSCFSDTTLDDLIGNALALEDVYLGRVGDQDGPGVDDVVNAHDHQLDVDMKLKLISAIMLMKEIPGPFDQALLDTDATGGDGAKRAAIRRSITAVQDVGDAVVEIAKDLELTIKTE